VNWKSVERFDCVMSVCVSDGAVPLGKQAWEVGPYIRRTIEMCDKKSGEMWCLHYKCSFAASISQIRERHSLAVPL
jgi:hypothetical protein